MEISRWSFTQTVREVDCPYCKASKGEACVFPSGRKTMRPHGKRSTAYINSIGREEFKKRHSCKIIKGTDALKAFLKRP